MFDRRFLTILAIIALLAGGLGTYIALKNRSITLALSKERTAGRIEITMEDHRRGAESPKITLIEYGETECPFCKAFHPVLAHLIAEYPDDVAWVYRHLPTPSHPKAIDEAHALECAAAQGGNEAFWKYLDLIFKVTPSNNGLDLALLPKLATDIGLDRKKFEACEASGMHKKKIENEVAQGLAHGIIQVPHLFILTKDGKEYILAGSRSYEYMKKAVETLLRETSEEK